MKLIHLEMHNFRQYTSSSLDFTEGVTGIVGPNGAGKTTILEAIGWSLYGSKALRGRSDTVRAHAAVGGSKAMVKLDFELAGTHYQVERSITASSISNAVLNVDGRALRSGTKEVDEAVIKLLGMDHQAFFTSFFTAQKELEFMASMDPRGRAAAISRMLGYDRLTKAREQSNADRLGLDREIAGLEKGLPNPEELKERKKNAQAALEKANELLAAAEADQKKSQQTLEKLKPLKEASDQKAKRAEEISHRLEIDNTDATRLLAQIAKYEEELKALGLKRDEYDKIKTRLAGFRKEAEELKKQEELARFESDRQRLTAQIDVLKNDIDELAKQAKALSNAGQIQTRAQAALQAAETTLAQTETKIQACRGDRIALQNSLQTKIKHLNEQSSELESKKNSILQEGPQGKCPTCERPLADELQTVIANFDAQLAEIAARIKETDQQSLAAKGDGEELTELIAARDALAAQIETLRAEKSNADSDVKEYNRLLADHSDKGAKLAPLQEKLSGLPVGFDEKLYQQLQDLKQSLQPDRDKYYALKGELERQSAVETELAGLNEQYKIRKSEIEKSETAQSELKFSKEDHEKLCADFEAASNQLNTSKMNVEKQRGEVKTAGAILAEVDREESEYRSKHSMLKTKRSERLHLETLTKSFDKLRADLNHRIRPELESIASELLAELTDGRYNTLEISESYSAMIRDDGELKPVISGGEDDIVNLALRLAVSQMIADRAGQSYSLLVLDEVFGSLDETRRDNVVGLLQNLKNRFDQIIVITHIESIHDMVDSCLWVEFDEQKKTSQLIDRSMSIDTIGAGLLPPSE